MHLDVKRRFPKAALGVELGRGGREEGSDSGSAQDQAGGAAPHHGWLRISYMFFLFIVLVYGGWKGGREWAGDALFWLGHGLAEDRVMRRLQNALTNPLRLLHLGNARVLELVVIGWGRHKWHVPRTVAQ